MCRPGSSAVLIAISPMMRVLLAEALLTVKAREAIGLGHAIRS